MSWGRLLAAFLSFGAMALLPAVPLAAAAPPVIVRGVVLSEASAASSGGGAPTGVVSVVVDDSDAAPTGHTRRFPALAGTQVRAGAFAAGARVTGAVLRLPVAPRSTESTEGGRAQREERGVSVFGAHLWTQSGWSSHVGSSWHNTTRRQRWICSVFNTPNYAPITYVG